LCITHRLYYYYVFREITKTRQIRCARWIFHTAAAPLFQFFFVEEFSVVNQSFFYSQIYTYFDGSPSRRAKKKKNTCTIRIYRNFFRPRDSTRMVIFFFFVTMWKSKICIHTRIHTHTHTHAHAHTHTHIYIYICRCLLLRTPISGTPIIFPNKK
jgi:hypothetical protein